MAQQAPEAVLLQEGINDLHSGYLATQVVDALRQMVREGQRRGATVFLGTLLPERQGSCRAGNPQDSVTANNLIRPMAATEGAVLVDLYQAFDGQLGTLLGQDGLHPSTAGYSKIAETFFEKVRQRFDSATSSN
jgi:lysophospholipase L1-like esterase